MSAAIRMFTASATCPHCGHKVSQIDGSREHAVEVVVEAMAAHVKAAVTMRTTNRATDECPSCDHAVDDHEWVSGQYRCFSGAEWSTDELSGQPILVIECECKLAAKVTGKR